MRVLILIFRSSRLISPSPILHLHLLLHHLFHVHLVLQLVVGLLFCFLVELLLLLCIKTQLAISDPPCDIRVAGHGPNGSSPPPHICDKSVGSLCPSYMHKCGPSSQKSGPEGHKTLKMAILLPFLRHQEMAFG